MRIITRVILIDLLVSLAEGMVLFTFVFLLKRLFSLADLFLCGGATTASMLQLVFSLLPFVMIITFPMSILLAALMVYGRMSNDNELIALHAAGYSIQQLLIPVLILGLLLSGLLFWWSHRIAPRGLRLFRTIAADVLRNSVSYNLQPGVFNRIGNYILVPSEITQDRITNLRMFETRNERITGTAGFPTDSASISSRIAGVISSPSGLITYSADNSTLNLSLYSGVLHQIPSADRDVVIQFQEMQFTIGIPALLQQMIKVGREEQRYSDTQLRFSIQLYRDTLNQETNEIKKSELLLILNRLRVERALRTALPFACLILPFIGALLGMESRFGKRSTCYGATIIAIFIYFMLLTFGKASAEAGNLPAYPAVWLPNLISLGIGFYLYQRMLRVPS